LTYAFRSNRLFHTNEGIMQTRRRVPVTAWILSLVLWIYTPMRVQAAIFDKRLPVSSVIPQLNIRVYSIPVLSAWVLRTAQAEAERLLRPTGVQWKWIDCAFSGLITSCELPALPSDLILRITDNKFPGKPGSAIGLTARSDGESAGFVLLDRVAALQMEIRSLPFILGRVMAHEIVHLLLPYEKHSRRGLMRAEWSVDDLSVFNMSCFGLTKQLVHSMQIEALRRMGVTEGLRH
jgi:hypothetical protein